MSPVCWCSRPANRAPRAGAPGGGRGGGRVALRGFLDGVSPPVLFPTLQDGMSQCRVLVEGIWALGSGGPVRKFLL